MTSRLRSSSLGAVPRQKPLSRSRAESSQAAPLEVRCACQFFQSDSLIPERINPIGSRPPSRIGAGDKPAFCSKHNIFEEETLEEENLSGSVLSFGKNSVPDYYADINNTYNSHTHEELQLNKENLPPPEISPPCPPLSFNDDRNIPPIEIETFKADIPITNLNKPSRIGGSTNIIHPPAINVLKGQFSSQKSLDRYSTSALLAKYRPKSQSHAPSLQGSAVDVRMFPRMTKTVSFDYGKSSNEAAHSDNPNFDQYHRMSPMVFPIRERLQRMERMSATRDHEYEPIGEPQTDMDIDISGQKRKGSNQEGGSEKKLLRQPTDESEDNISAQDFQDQIESRFFRKEIEPIAKEEVQQHPESTFEEAVIIDEEPIVREIPKKRSFMASAQKSGMNFQKKIKAQASSLKNKMKKKPKEQPVAVEVAHVDEPEQTKLPEEEEEKENQFESITINVQEAEEEAAKSKKSLKMPKFTKNIKAPSMPKFKKPEMPDLKVSERFSSLRKLGRSKSMKNSEAGESVSLNSPEIVSAEPSAKKKFDFGTYPRIIRDKFKRQKLPERSDRSIISDSPAPDDDFNRVTTQFAQRGPVASRWPEYNEEGSGKYQHFDSESDIDRERLELEQEARHLMSEEQRQLDDMDRENLQIHLMAKQEKFRKPYVERQESDVTSEDDKLMWSGVLNKNVKQEEEDFEPNALRFGEDYKYRLDVFNNEELLRSSTPQTNQETQSSGSSGTRRRTGMLDDDEEYFLREHQRVSSNLQPGDYIDTAIKEGLSSPDKNALAQMGSIEEMEGQHREFTPEKPIRSLKRKKKQAIQPEIELNKEKYDKEMATFDAYFKKCSPVRPVRKEKNSLSVEDPDDEINFNQEFPDDTSDIIEENEMATFKGIEHPDLAYLGDDYDNEIDYNAGNLPVPPTPPRRRKKKIRSFLPSSNLRNQSNQKQINDDEPVAVFRQQLEFVPLAQEEHFTTPTPTPRRTRSRSQISGYTLDDAASFNKDSIEGFIIHTHDNKENDYATVRKELPSRPVRRKRSTKSLGDRQFATLPLMPKRTESGAAPPRPPRNYSTIIPDKPPRRKSAGSLVEISKTRRVDDDDYEEILDKNEQTSNRLSQRLQSGDIINKMKDRPLPPPPRPQRHGHKKVKREDPKSDEKFDDNQGAEKIALEALSIDTTDMLQVEQQPVAEKELPRQDSDFSEPIERPIEVEVSTQTDPVPDEDFALEDDDDIDIQEFVGSDGHVKTLEEILKEEQDAELERARQLAEAENLARGIQRFRESSQRSLSERTGASADRSRSLSRPITPSAVVVEMKKSSPIIFDKEEQIVTEAGLFIHPITYDDFGIPPAENEEAMSQPEPAPINESPVGESLDVNNNFEAEQRRQELEDPAVSPEPDVAEIIRQAKATYAQDDDDDEEELDSEMQRKIEEMIESVMNSAREETEWRKEEKKINVEEPHQEKFIENVEQLREVEEVLCAKKETNKIVDSPPLPPPRRKSNLEESILTRDSSMDAVQQIEEDEQPNDVFTTQDSAQNTEELQLEKSDPLSEERPSSPFPSRLHISSLEIDNLSVNALQAGRISASEIDSHTIVTNDFECRSSSNLPQMPTIELPPGLIEQIVERVRSAERAEMQAEQQKITEQSQSVQSEDPPTRPPLPSEYSPTSPIPPSFYQLRDNSEEDPTPRHRRRRHHPKRRDSTSEEEFQKDQRTRPKSGAEQSVASLGSQFARACGNALIDSGSQLMEILRASSKDENKRDLHVAIMILVIIVAGLFLMNVGEKSVHHHHWDFFNPPENPGR